MSFYNKLNQPTLIHQDFETFSEVDISRVGGVAYSCHPSTQVLICGYAFDNGEVKQWIPAHGDPLPAELEDAVLDPRILKYGWHASFEQAIWTNTLQTPTPAPSWRDTMVMAKVCSFPGKLSSVCDILALLPSHKKKDGTEVIKYFCTPHGGEQRTRHDNSDLWLDALEYNKFDVLAMQRIYAILKNFAPSDSEWDLWQIDQKINQFGLPVNLDMVRNACAIADDLMPRLASRITAITGIDRPKNRDKILYWLKAHGYKFDDLKAENVARALDKTPKHTELYKVLHLRQQISKKSASHFPAFLDATDSDGRARHLFNFNNTRQGRWTAHGPRPHGLSGHAKGFEDIKWVRTAGGHKKAVDGRQLRISRAIPKMKPSDFRMFFENPIEVLGGCVRHAIEAPKGRVIISADLKFIEHLVLGWIAEDEEILSVIRSGKDPYLFFATRIYDLPYEELFKQHKGGDNTKRKLAKPGLLGCGFMMGWQALLEHAGKNGVELTPDVAKHIVKVWRETYSGVVDFWGFIYQMALECVKTGDTKEWGPIRFELRASFLCLVLPSGRIIYYHKPQIKSRTNQFNRKTDCLTYEGRNDRGIWERLVANPGTITEHIVSGIARDIMAHGLVSAHGRGLDIFLHLHDQIAAEADEEHADRDLTILKESMVAPPEWWGDLPILVDGYISKCFIKD